MFLWVTVGDHNVSEFYVLYQAFSLLSCVDEPEYNMTIAWHVVGYGIGYGMGCLWEAMKAIWFSSKNLGLKDRGFL